MEAMKATGGAADCDVTREARPDVGERLSGEGV